MAFDNPFPDAAATPPDASFLNKVLTRVGLISPAESVVSSDSESPEPATLRLTMRQAGFRASGQHNGMAGALEIHLHRILSALHEQFDQSHKQQDTARRQKQAEIEATDTDIAHQQDERKTVENRIERQQQQIRSGKKKSTPCTASRPA